MKVVLDLQGAQTESRHRGIGRYTLALARGILRNAGDHDVWVGLTTAIPETIPAIRETLADLLPDNRLVIWNSVAPTGDAHAVNDGRRAQAQVVREAFLGSLQADIIHCSSVFEGLEADSVTSIHRHFQGPPTAATLYDLIPLVDRSRYLADGQMERWYRQRLAELKRADLLLAISEHTQHEAYRLLGLPPERIVNIRAGADAVFAPQTVSGTREAGLRKRFGLTKPFVMFTGGLDARKNIKGLITAFAMLSPELRETHQLALVGHADEKIDRANLDHAIAQGLRPDQVVFTGFVSDEDMVALYNLSTGFVFPSQYEGFGLPPLEAMSCGTPTIASNTTSIPEVVGDPAAMFDPYDPAAISRKMSRLLTDATFREGLRTRGLERAKTFSWDDSAVRALAAFEELVRSQKPKTSRIAPKALAPAPRRPRLALVTGLPKRPSADRDRLIQLVEQLDVHYSVDIVTGAEVEPGLFEGPARLVSSERFDEVSGAYDRVVHRYANTADFGHVRDVQARHPGIVLLEDYFLDRALSCASGRLDPSGAWVQTVIEAYGYNGLRRALHGRAPGDPAPRLPLYPAIIGTAHGVMVTDPRITELASEDLGPEATKDWVSVPLLLPTSGTNADTSQPQSIAAFGVGVEHLHHRLVAAWLASRELSRDSQLLIVGPGQHDAYGRHLAKRLRESHPGGRWKVISSDDAAPELGKIRLVVKLSDDQDSATDRWRQACEVRGIPVLTADDLGDTLDQGALASALETAWHRAPTQPAAPCDRVAPADVYRDAIEHLQAHGRLTEQLDILRVAAQQPALTSEDWTKTVLAVLRNHPVPDAPRQLMLDLTMMVQVDARTGIQRVTRSLARCLLDDPPEGFRVEPIYSDEDGELRYARTYAASMLGYDGTALRDEPVVVRDGDVLVGLDLNDRMFPSDTMAGPSMAPALEWLWARGVGRQFVVYDLLPCSHPGWFPWPDHWFPTYLHNLVRYADALICISQATARDLTEWIGDNCPDRGDLPVDWFHLGADIEKSVPSDHMTDDFERRWANRGIGPSILMVGTIEPRKGHDQALAAFSSLWNEGVNANLVIVGQAGWGRDELLRMMAMHPEWGRRLLWFEGASDAELMRLYRVADGCLMPSRGEGFGLPLIEAARYDIPVLARDLPVFEEIAQDNVTYFSGKSAKSLATALRGWFAALAAGTAPRSGGIEWMTWDQSTKHFVAALRRHLAD